jgi:esterase/lipase superfamily enzyme
VRLIALIAAALAAMTLAGCAGRPDGILVPVAETAPGASKVEMLVATTRSAQGATPGEMFTGERGQSVQFADLTISIPPDSARKIGEVQWPSGKIGNPATDFVTLKAEKLVPKEAARRFSARIKRTPNRQVLLFVHGYNTRFEEAVYRFAQIVHDSHAEVQPVLFTWPSRGQLLAYGYDRESANYSRDALESILQILAKDPNVGEISILAHSMGNWVTMEALRQMAIRNKGIASKIKNVMLASPDVDPDVFRRQLAEIGPKRPPFILFTSQDDAALGLSRRVWGGLPRLGAVDPAKEPYKSEFAAEKLTVVDLTKVKANNSIAHDKFAQSGVVNAIGARLASGQALGDGGASLGETLGQVATGAVSTVGTAASIIVTAPVAIIDPRSRDAFGSQFNRLGANATNLLRSGTGEGTIPY